MRKGNKCCAKCEILPRSRNHLIEMHYIFLCFACAIMRIWIWFVVFWLCTAARGYYTQWQRGCRALCSTRLQSSITITSQVQRKEYRKIVLHMQLNLICEMDAATTYMKTPKWYCGCLFAIFFLYGSFL